MVQKKIHRWHLHVNNDLNSLCKCIYHLQNEIETHSSLKLIKCLAENPCTRYLFFFLYLFSQKLNFDYKTHLKCLSGKNYQKNVVSIQMRLLLIQCPRTDLNKKFLTRPMTTTQVLPHEILYPLGPKSAIIEISHITSFFTKFECTYSL